MKIIIAVLIFVLSAVPVFQQSEILAARKIDINTASYEELQEIIWVGPDIARRIRESRPFYSLDDIIKVRGIGEKRLEDIKKQGLAWVNPETKPSPGLERKIQPEQEQKPVPEQELQPSPEPQAIVYPSNVLINEILPSPEGPDAEEEWIEIFNQNNFEVNLFGWQITDTIGRTKIYVFPTKTLIEPKRFLVLSRPISKITLNNDQDALKLLRPDGKIADSVKYEKAPRGKSYNRPLLDNDNLTDANSPEWFWSSVLTPGMANIRPVIFSAEEAVKQTEEQKAKFTEEPLKREPALKYGLGAIKEQVHFPEQRNKVSKSEWIWKTKVSKFFGFWNALERKNMPVFVIALVTALFSGTIILILKRKIKTS